MPQVALVTGAGGPVGHATADALRRSGWAVMAAADGTGEPHIDLAAPNTANELVIRVLDEFGRLDLLTACQEATMVAPIEAHEIKDWWRVVDTNLSASFRLARAATPALLSARGSIVFVSSDWGITGRPGATAYCASKAGLIGLTKALARELAPDVRVNAVAPGGIDLGHFVEDAAAAAIPVEEMVARFSRASLLQRLGTTTDVAATIRFLASDDARYYTGQVLRINGGRTWV